MRYKARMSLRRLDRLGIFVALITCVGLGVQQVAVKLALPTFPGLTQAAVRSAGAILPIALWLWWREPKAYVRDGTLWPGIATGHDHPEISFCAPASRAAMSTALLYHKRLIHIAA